VIKLYYVRLLSFLLAQRSDCPNLILILTLAVLIAEVDHQTFGHVCVFCFRGKDMKWISI
jgi:hypothetical protein